MGARLEAEGYLVALDDGRDVSPGSTATCDIAVVDLGLTSRSSSEVLTALRARSSMPILAVSPIELRSPMVLEAYEAGADQVVIESVGPRELVARIRALMRRTPAQAGDLDGGFVDVGSFTVDAATCIATVEGQKVKLTADECAVVLALVRRPGAVVQREDLAAQIPGGHPGAMLDSLVRQLRNKLEAVEGRRRIEAVRGVGFRVAIDADLAGPWQPEADEPLEGLACA